MATFSLYPHNEYHQMVNIEAGNVMLQYGNQPLYSINFLMHQTLTFFFIKC